MTWQSLNFDNQDMNLNVHPVELTCLCCLLWSAYLLLEELKEVIQWMWSDCLYLILFLGITVPFVTWTIPKPAGWSVKSHQASELSQMLTTFKMAMAYLAVNAQNFRADSEILHGSVVELLRCGGTVLGILNDYCCKFAAECASERIVKSWQIIKWWLFAPLCICILICTC